MDRYFIKKDIDLNSPMQDLLDTVKQGLMTPDMCAASAAGCTFDVQVKRDDKGVTVRMSTREKVSIMRWPDGRPVSVLVDRRHEEGRL
jgi:hypothetical protein